MIASQAVHTGSIPAGCLEKQHYVKIISTLNITDWDNKEFVFFDCDNRYIVVGNKVKEAKK